jgi:hypothetical protein
LHSKDHILAGEVLRKPFHEGGHSVGDQMKDFASAAIFGLGFNPPAPAAAA